MNNQEKEEIESLPYKYRPISPWGYWGYQLLFSIPVAGFILMIIYAFNKDNINRRNFARSYFYVLIVSVVLALIAGAIALIVIFAIPAQN